MQLLQQTLRRFAWAKAPVIFLSAYAAWGFLCEVGVLTTVTYFLSGTKTPLPEIAEVVSAGTIPLIAFTVLGFTLMLRLLFPLVIIPKGEIFETRAFYHDLLPGFLKGVTVATGVVAAFFLTGHYQFLGFSAELQESPVNFFPIFLRALYLAIMVYCEEYFFRQRLIGEIRKSIGPTYAIVIAAVCYCGFKAFQFNLGVMHLGTLFLMALLLGVEQVAQKSFVKGAGLWAGLLIAFNPLFSLPILGHEFQGAFWIQFQREASRGSWHEILFMDTSQRIALFLTGGTGGPLSSFALQIMLTAFVVRQCYKYREMLVHPHAGSVL